MKRLACLFLTVVFLFPIGVSAFAAEGSDDSDVVSAEVVYSDAVETNEYLTLMIMGEDVYVSATELATHLGYSISIQDKYATVYNTTNDELAGGFTIFYFDSTKVEHTLFSRMISNYEAPFESIKYKGDAWIPFEYALLILGSSVSIVDDVLYIDIPEKSIIDVFYTAMCNAEKYNFDWDDDFGYSNLDTDIIGTSSHLVNLFNGVLKSDGDSWVEMFQAFANDSTAYDNKFGEDLALLLCTESSGELAAETKKIKKYKDLLSADGKLGKILSQYSDSLDNDIEAWRQTCATILSEVQEGNSSLAQYNKAYQALEKALDKQMWFSDTGGTILEVQKGIKNAIPVLDAALTVLEVIGYGEEFENQDDFSVDSLNMVLLNMGENSFSSGAMKTSMVAYTEDLQTNVIAYSTKRYFDENVDGWIKKGLGITELLGTQANIELLAWSLLSSFSPRLSDSLSAADKFELALYSSVFSSDMYTDYQCARDDAFLDTENISAEKLYVASQYCYTYLKSCYITRDAALASLKGKSSDVQEQLQPLIDEQNTINEEIAGLLVVLKDANKTNDGLVYGFLPSDNKEYLSEYDSSKIVSALSDISSDTDVSSYDEILDAYYTALSEGWDMQQYRDMQQFSENGLCYLCSYEDTSSVGYAFIDINEDGIEELLIGLVDATGGYIGFFYDLYTIIDETVVQVISSGERSRYHMCTDSSIAYEGSGGATISDYQYYAFDGSSKLVFIEEVLYDADYNKENPWFYIEQEEASKENYIPITDEKAKEIIESYSYAEISWTSFSEYTLLSSSSIMPEDEASLIWEEFLRSGEYSNYTEEWSDFILEYTIVDLNADQIQELLIQAEDETFFYNTWTFTLSGTSVAFVDETYGYGSFRYSPSYNAIVVSPEWKPFDGTSYCPFYSLQGTELNYIFEIIQDEGVWYYYGANGVTQELSDEERVTYFSDVINFDWTQLS